MQTRSDTGSRQTISHTQNVQVNLRKLLIPCFLAFSAFGACAGQQHAMMERRVQVGFNNVEIHRALKTVMRDFKVSYTVSSEVKGTVTLASDYEELPRFLHDLLLQVNATFRVEKGVYNIIPATGGDYLVSIDAENVPLSQALDSICQPVKVHFDLWPGTAHHEPLVSAHLTMVPFMDALREVLRNCSATFFVDEGHLVVRPNAVLNHITFNLLQFSFYDMLGFIFTQTDASILVYPMPEGRAKAEVRDMSLDQTLNTVLPLVGATGRMDGNIYLIYPRQ